VAALRTTSSLRASPKAVPRGQPRTASRGRLAQRSFSFRCRPVLPSPRETALGIGEGVGESREDQVHVRLVRADAHIIAPSTVIDRHAPLERGGRLGCSPPPRACAAHRRWAAGRGLPGENASIGAPKSARWAGVSGAGRRALFFAFTLLPGICPQDATPGRLSCWPPRCPRTWRFRRRRCGARRPAVVGEGSGPASPYCLHPIDQRAAAEPQPPRRGGSRVSEPRPVDSALPELERLTCSRRR